MFELPDLPYAYDALQPAISKQIMELHHDGHHKTYVTKLNDAVNKEPSLADKTIEELLSNLDIIPEAVRTQVRNNGGGHYNHSNFWLFMKPGGSEPSGKLADDLTAKFGSLDDFKEQFATTALGVFGSGWAWLMPDLSLTSTPNQDNPISSGKPAPILGLDVWEHAYYLDYHSNRADYIKAWWSVVNWDEVAKRYQKGD